MSVTTERIAVAVAIALVALIVALIMKRGGDE